MQRITNCIIEFEGRILLMKKPRRGWWYAPGGKMEHDELVPEAAEREVYEETGLTIKSPELRAIVTHLVSDGESYLEKRTMFLFHAKAFNGTLRSTSKEGELAWIPEAELETIPMDEADRVVTRALLHEQGLMFGTFVYDQHRNLLSKKLEAGGRRIS
ncbi:NUDIX hydrolase [Alkalicoccus chagannorensis]|uniref:NUDIX hydrolase n=1 Tax=Alkalicoccus chagannorensis TaxID=427072 RepID=UPI0004789419|nr:NUDIX domain-containing protein [Alkalicoccus chagannorensis]